MAWNEIVGFVAFVIWWGAMWWVVGFSFGKKRGDTTNYNVQTAHINVMPGATLTTETKSTPTNGSPQ